MNCFTKLEKSTGVQKRFVAPVRKSNQISTGLGLFCVRLDLFSQEADDLFGLNNPYHPVLNVDYRQRMQVVFIE